MKEFSFNNFLKTTENSNSNYLGSKKGSVVFKPIVSENKFEHFEKKSFEFHIEKRVSLNELSNAMEEINSLSTFFDDQYLKNFAKIREKELRSHILTLQENLNNQDVEQSKILIQNLYDDIMQSVIKYHDQIREELQNKKKDIGHSIDVRLLNAEKKHKKELNEKVDEQAGMLEILNNVNCEMIRIKENYERIKKKNDHYYVANTEFQKKIKEETEKNKFLSLQMKQFKRCIKYLNSKLQNDEVIAVTDSCNRLSTELTFKNFKNKIQNLEELNYYPNNKEVSNKASTYIQMNYFTNSTGSKSNRNLSKLSRNMLTTKNESLSTFKQTKNTLTDKIPPSEMALLRSNRTSEVLKHTLTMYKSKVNSLKKEYDYSKASNSQLSSRVYELMGKVKMKSQMEKSVHLGGSHSTTNKYSNKIKYFLKSEAFNKNFSTPRKESSEVVNVSKMQMMNFNLEERKRFISAIVNDKTIMELIEDKRFPKINVTYRSVNMEGTGFR